MPSDKPLMKAIKSWTETIIIAALNFLVLFLLFPLIKTVVIITVLLCTLAISSGIYYIRNSKGGNPKIRWLFLSFAFVMAGLTWNCIGPFIVLKKPIYVIFQESYNPSDAKVNTLIPENNDSGSILMLSDPFRKYFFSIVELIFDDNVRLIEIKKFQDKDYIVFPLKNRFEKIDLHVTSGLSTRTLWIPLRGLSITLDLKESTSSKKIEKINTSIGYYTTQLVSHRYINFEVNPPWEAIIKKEFSSIRDLQYAGIIDNALFLVGFGDIDEAMGQLDYAVKIAPNEIEKARAIYLLGRIIEFRFNGNIGRTQSLTLYQAVYDLLKAVSDSQKITSIEWTLSKLGYFHL